MREMVWQSNFWAMVYGAEKTELWNFDTSEDQPRLDDNVACNKYVQLNKICTDLLFSWQGLSEYQKLSSSKFVHQLERHQGFVYLVGLDNVCQAQEDMVKKRIALNDDERSLVPDCFDHNLRKYRIEFLSLQNN
jgi:hypothetical protein